jgi:hypothetical protein
VIDDPKAEKWCFRCASVDAGDGGGKAGESIQAVTVESLMKDHGMSSIDILKLDIEGAEKKVFSANDTSWLSKVRVIICELHPGCWRSFFEALKPYDYDCRQLGENIVVLMHALASASGVLKKLGR